jgi:MATE family multidrug resistance protein
MTPMMIGIFLEPDSFTETLDLATWGTQLNAFMMFILAWSAILGGALRGVGDTYGAMTIFAAFWWFQYLLVLVLIRIFELTPSEVLAIHAFSSPILCLAMLARFRSGAWRKLELVSA